MSPVLKLTRRDCLAQG